MGIEFLLSIITIKIVTAIKKADLSIISYKSR